MIFPTKHALWKFLHLNEVITLPQQTRNSQTHVWKIAPQIASYITAYSQGTDTYKTVQQYFEGLKSLHHVPFQNRATVFEIRREG